MSVEFARDIKGLFREGDRTAMKKARSFDLWNYVDVVKWAEAIQLQVESGDMPCDAAWPTAYIDLFKKWIADGKLP